MKFFMDIILKIRRYMSNCNGFDNLAIMAYVLSVVTYMIGIICGIEIMGLLGTALFLYSVFRVFSRNVIKRREENQKLLEFRWKIISKFRQKNRKRKDRKNYRYFKCPNCQQNLRIPKGRGKVDVTCPKCGIVFEERS